MLHFSSLHVAPRYVLLNVHNLLHLVEDVKVNGPLWCNSLFVFEDWNGDITECCQPGYYLFLREKDIKKDQLMFSFFQYT